MERAYFGFRQMTNDHIQLKDSAIAKLSSPTPGYNPKTPLTFKIRFCNLLGPDRSTARSGPAVYSINHKRKIIFKHESEHLAVV